MPLPFGSREAMQPEPLLSSLPHTAGLSQDPALQVSWVAWQGRVQQAPTGWLGPEGGDTQSSHSLRPEVGEHWVLWAGIPAEP